MIPTSASTQTSATICRMRGWEAGQILVECDPERRYAARAIRITAIGQILVRAVELADPAQSEYYWNLTCRDWREATPDELRILPNTEVGIRRSEVGMSQAQRQLNQGPDE